MLKLFKASNQKGFTLHYSKRLNKNVSLNMKNSAGFTYIELIIVLGIVLMLFGVAFLNSSRFASRTDLSSQVDTLLSDLKSQQTKAMTGSTIGGTSPESYGIFFLSDSYVLFHGTSYNANDNSNFVVELPSAVDLEGTFPNNIIVFSALSGEIVSFSSGANTITLQTSGTSEETTITLNRYGVITQVN